MNPELDKISNWARQEGFEVVTSDQESQGDQPKISIHRPAGAQITCQLGNRGECTVDGVIRELCEELLEHPEKLNALIKIVSTRCDGLVNCQPVSVAGRQAIRVTGTMFLDGLTKQSALAMVDSIAKTMELLEMESAALVAESAAWNEIDSMFGEFETIAKEMAQTSGTALDDLVGLQTRPDAPPVSIPEFCTHCGHHFLQDARYCPVCGAAAQSELEDLAAQHHICLDCGNTLQGGQQYCTNCGKPVELTSQVNRDR